MKKQFNYKMFWRITSWLFWIGFAWWQIETFYFLRKYGFHWKPINETEDTCNNIVIWIWIIDFVFWCQIIKNIIKLFICIEAAENTEEKGI